MLELRVIVFKEKFKEQIEIYFIPYRINCHYQFLFLNLLTNLDKISIYRLFSLCPPHLLFCLFLYLVLVEVETGHHSFRLKKIFCFLKSLLIIIVYLPFFKIFTFKSQIQILDSANWSQSTFFFFVMLPTSSLFIYFFETLGFLCLY